MFDNLSDKLQRVFKSLRGEGKLTPENMEAALREIRVALLEADVNLNVVRELIEHQCGVRYHEAHVWRILRQLGWSCQRPTGRALERDEEAIRYWKRVRWPRLKKKRSASGAPSSSSTKAG